MILIVQNINVYRDQIFCCFLQNKIQILQFFLPNIYSQIVFVWRGKLNNHDI